MSEQDEQLNEAIERYVKVNFESQYHRHGGNPAKLDEAWERAKHCGLDLTQDNKPLIGGRLPDAYIASQRRDPDIEKRFFDYASRKAAGEVTASVEAPLPAKDSVPKRSQQQQQPDVLYVSAEQLCDQRFMRQAGPEITAAIRTGKVMVDDARAVKSGTEIAAFLALKPEPAPQAKAEAPTKRTTEASRDQILDQRFVRKLDAEWKTDGGYLAAISRGDIKIV